MNSIFRIGTRLLCLLLLVGAVGACSSKPKPITAERVRADMTPELKSIAETGQQRQNSAARERDNTIRQIPDDVDAFWLQHRARRLSNYKIP